jgi:DNA (cytosine-5)-methyltransferase 1
MPELTCLEMCAGGGGQALGLEQAGFTHTGLVETDPDCCDTLIRNRPHWPVLQGDISRLPDGWLQPADLVAGGLPCTPHTRGGRQLGVADERHLWDAALRIITAVRPRAVMLETSNAILTSRFDNERDRTTGGLLDLGYRLRWDEVDCSRHSVPQRRRRAVLIGIAVRGTGPLPWPEPSYPGIPLTVGAVLYPMAAAYGWEGARYWAGRARDAAPTVVGGSRKHGGPDLGASQGKEAWRRLGIDPMGIADGPPGPDGTYPRGRGRTGNANETGLMLTTEMAARLQGFPPDWQFCGTKTARYRQVGNAFPPPAARALGQAIAKALEHGQETAA